VYSTTLPLLVFHLTGSISSMALVAATTPAAMLTAPVLGAIVDRWGPRMLVVPGLIVQAIAAVMFNLLLHGAHTSSGVVAVCAFAVALGGEAYQIGWMTGVPEMFPACKTQARGALNTLYFLSSVVGPLIVAALLPVLGYIGLLWLNLATFCAPIVVWFTGIKPQPRHSAAAPTGANGTEDERSARPGFFASMVEGWRALRHDRVLAPIVGANLCYSAAFGGGMTSLYIFQMRAGFRWSGRASSLVFFVLEAGIFLGSLWITIAANTDPARRLQRVTAVRIVAVAALGLPFGPGFVVLLFIAGGASGARITSNEMMMISLTRPDALGRVTGIRWLLSGTAALVCSALVGWLPHLIGVPSTFVVLAAIASPCIALVGVARKREPQDSQLSDCRTPVA
jgi:sugar phosphate permease